MWNEESVWPPELRGQSTFVAPSLVQLRALFVERHKALLDALTVARSMPGNTKKQRVSRSAALDRVHLDILQCRECDDDMAALYSAAMEEEKEFLRRTEAESVARLDALRAAGTVSLSAAGGPEPMVGMEANDPWLESRGF